MAKPQAIELSELERDALTELANIGVSRAATNLSEMMGRQVFLSVPAVAIVTNDHAAQILQMQEANSLVAVHQAFVGDFSGRVLLIFPETNSLALVRAVAGGDLPLEDIIELEQEALAETGNIILNGCLSAIANMLRRSLSVSLPEIVRGSGPDLFELPEADAEDVVLFLYKFFRKRPRYPWVYRDAYGSFVAGVAAPPVARTYSAHN